MWNSCKINCGRQFRLKSFFYYHSILTYCGYLGKLLFQIKMIPADFIRRLSIKPDKRGWKGGAVFFPPFVYSSIHRLIDTSAIFPFILMKKTRAKWRAWNSFVLIAASQEGFAFIFSGLESDCKIFNNTKRLETRQCVGTLFVSMFKIGQHDMLILFV